MEYEAMYTINRRERLVIYGDSDQVSPREWDNVGTMICQHRRYDLGDSQDQAKEWSDLVDHHPSTNVGDIYAMLAEFDPENPDDLPGKALIAERDKAERKGRREWVAIPLYLYDHSGITIRTEPFSCPWDSGQVGYIYVSKARAMKELGIKRWGCKEIDRVKECLRNEVEVYDFYLRGAVYGYSREKLERGEWVEQDSCWGFYGDNPSTNGIFDSALTRKEWIRLAHGDLSLVYPTGYRNRKSKE